MRARTVLLAPCPAGRGSRRAARRRAGITLIFSLAQMLRRGERHAEHRLDEHGQERVALAQRVERRGRIAVERDAERLEQRRGASVMS